MKTEKETTPIFYKGFDKDWSCRGFKYGEPKGQIFTTDKPILLCNFGFHACEAPLDIWDYYPPFDGNVAGLVELGGVSDEKEKDTKRVGSSITIKAAITIPALIAAQIEWTFNAAKKFDHVADKDSVVVSSGYYSKAASSGYYSKAASSGNSSTAASSGDYSKAASSGYYSTAASSGNSSTAASSGDYSKAACDTNGFACVAGLNGRVKGGSGSALSLGYKDLSGKNRIAVGYVGENGIKEGVFYRCDDNGNLVPA